MDHGAPSLFSALQPGRRPPPIWRNAPPAPSAHAPARAEAGRVWPRPKAEDRTGRPRAPRLLTTNGEVRVNQVGYLPLGEKYAYVAVFPSPFLDECGPTLPAAIDGPGWIPRYR